MMRATALLGLALLAAGCGDGGKPTADQAAPDAPPGKPAVDEARMCIAAYLGQCGWKDVELSGVADHDGMPKGAPAPTGEAWAFTFSATYTNLFGERQASVNWVAVLGRSDGQPCVKSCYDDSRRLVGGHSGAERTDVADSLTPMPPAAEFPIVLPPPQP